MTNQKTKIKNPDDVVCVLALDPHTRLSVTSTSCDRKDAAHYAQYYRSVGYRTKTLDYEELNAYLERESRVRQMEIRNLNLAMAEGGI